MFSGTSIVWCVGITDIPNLFAFSVISIGMGMASFLFILISGALIDKYGKRIIKFFKNIYKKSISFFKNRYIIHFKGFETKDQEISFYLNREEE